jgi:hypothetical protein
VRLWRTFVEGQEFHPKESDARDRAEFLQYFASEECRPFIRPITFEALKSTELWRKPQRAFVNAWLLTPNHAKLQRRLRHSSKPWSPSENNTETSSVPRSARISTADAADGRQQPEVR